MLLLMSKPRLEGVALITEPQESFCWFQHALDGALHERSRTEERAVIVLQAQYLSSSEVSISGSARGARLPVLEPGCTEEQSWCSGSCCPAWISAGPAWCWEKSPGSRVLDLSPLSISPLLTF